MFHLASSAVNSLPLWNFTPWRSLNVYVSPSGVTVHDSARSAVGCCLASRPTSRLKTASFHTVVFGETGCGLVVAIGKIIARVSVPPFLGVTAAGFVSVVVVPDWIGAHAARPTAPAATPKR